VLIQDLPNESEVLQLKLYPGCTVSADHVTEHEHAGYEAVPVDAGHDNHQAKPGRGSHKAEAEPGSEVHEAEAEPGSEPDEAEIAEAEPDEAEIAEAEPDETEIAEAEPDEAEIAEVEPDEAEMLVAVEAAVDH
jgi:hypothetical protein